MINPTDFDQLILRPTLTLIARFDERLHTDASIALLMGTAAQESDMGFWLDQIGGGPGLGPFSIESDTNHSIWRHYLSRPSKSLLRDLVLSLVPQNAIIEAKDADITYVYVDPAQLVGNFPYSVAMARLKYWPKKEALPDSTDIFELGRYWDVHYNVNAEHGTPEEFVESWEQYLKNWKL